MHRLKDKRGLTTRARSTVALPHDRSLARFGCVFTVGSSRELANQIFGVVSKFAVSLDEAKPLLLVGGTSVEDCLTSFRKGGASIVVGTPGRVEDMLNNYNVFDTRGELFWGWRRACAALCVFFLCLCFCSAPLADGLNRSLNFIPLQKKNSAINSSESYIPEMWMQL